MGGAVSKTSSSKETETDNGTHGPARKRVQVDRAGSPVPSCLSMKSDRSMDRPVYFSGEFKGDQRVQVDRAGSRVPSCLSMKSDRSMDRPVYFSGEFKGDQRIHCSLDLSRSDETSSEKLFSTKQV
ncbi:hypothetical protein ANANG_G00308520 [Anguilla anguilla]|uniref:Uncharacterized protein n=1 Tax=Anguilla anguilla TaxID=7936 RepID=A0A9D3LJ29_ANGAN|nr:hypothetical protein ANANG_G00308520 [Anguilla anguilla]